MVVGVNGLHGQTVAYHVMEEECPDLEPVPTQDLATAVLSALEMAWSRQNATLVSNAQVS